MSTIRMTSLERTQRSLARSHGKLAREYVELASPWNRAGERYVDAAYHATAQAAHHALLSIEARERRGRRGLRVKNRGDDGGSRT